MHLSLLIFASLLASVTLAAVGVPRKTTEREFNEAIKAFKHFPGYLFNWEFRNGSPEWPLMGQNGYWAPYFTVCKFAYCHAQNYDNCLNECATMTPKVDMFHLGHRITQWSSNEQPDATKEECVKECKEDCGSKNCEPECQKLCSIHWSYPNRREYEAEFYKILELRNNH